MFSIPISLEYITCDVRNGVAVVKFDNPKEKVNSLSEEFSSQMEAHLERILTDSSITSGVLISGKPENFIVGADITMLEKCKSAAESETLARGKVQLLKCLLLVL